jgi:hypothetical protein
MHHLAQTEYQCYTYSVTKCLLELVHYHVIYGGVPGVKRVPDENGIRGCVHDGET